MPVSAWMYVEIKLQCECNKTSFNKKILQNIAMAPNTIYIEW